MGLSRITLWCTFVVLSCAPCAAETWAPWDSDFFNRPSADHERAPRWESESQPNRGRRRKSRPAVQDGGPRPVIAVKAPPIVAFPHNFPVNSIIIDTSSRKLFFFLDESRAYEYAISVGREGFNWTGTETVSRKEAWPDWYPPAEMRERDPSLPRRMTGGVRNPLGAVALYLG